MKKNEKKVDKKIDTPKVPVLDSNKNTCCICGSELLTNNVKQCHICLKYQTNLQSTLCDYPHLTKGLKVVLTAICIPLLIFGLTTWILNFQSANNLKQNKISEISSSIPLLKAARAEMYINCMGLSKEDCAKNIHKSMNDYLHTVAKVSDLVSRHVPKLLPVVLLLDNINVSSDFYNVWNVYFSCLDDKKSRAECQDRRNKLPIMGVEIANFTIQYLDCKLQAELDLLNGNKGTEYCKSTVEKREEVLLTYTSTIMKEYDGMRIPKELKQVEKRIMCEFIFPDSGLTVRGINCNNKS